MDDHGVLRLARHVPADASWAVADGGAAFHVSSPPHVVHEIGVFGSSGQLLEWAEERAQDTPAPEGARVVLQSTVLEQDRSARSLLVDSRDTPSSAPGRISRSSWTLPRPNHCGPKESR